MTLSNVTANSTFLDGRTRVNQLVVLMNQLLDTEFTANSIVLSGAGVSLNVENYATIAGQNVISVIAAAFDKANSTTINAFSTIDANGISLVADANNDTLYIISSDNVSIVGDATGDNVVFDLVDSAVTPGVYGSGSFVPVITVDSKGRVSSVTNAAVTTTSTSAAFNHANAAYDQANTARGHANAGFGTANTASTIGSAAFGQANTAQITGVAAFAQANSSATIGSAAYGQANTARTHANAGFSQANTAQTTGVAAFAKANTFASTTANGITKYATSTEISTSTESAKSMTPADFSDSVYGIRYIPVGVFGPTSNCSTGDGKAFFHIPPGLNGFGLMYTHGEAGTAGTTGTMDVQIRKNSATDMLSTKLTWDSTESGTDTAATAAVIKSDGSQLVATNDVISIDVDAVQTTPAKGMVVTLGFRIP